MRERLGEQSRGDERGDGQHHGPHKQVAEDQADHPGRGHQDGGTAEQGARTQLMIVASIHQLADAPGVPLTARFDPEDLPSGAYLSDGIVTPPSSMVRDVELRQQLWQWTERALSITQ